MGSTAAMLRFAQEDASESYIVATEHGILHKMQALMPQKQFIPAPGIEDNTCACSECAFMKMNTLQKLHDCMQFESPEILLDSSLARKALIPIQRMFDITAN